MHKTVVLTITHNLNGNESNKIFPEHLFPIAMIGIILCTYILPRLFNNLYSVQCRLYDEISVRNV